MQGLFPGKRFELPLESVNVRCRREGRRECGKCSSEGRRQRIPSAFQPTSVSAAVRLMDGEVGSVWAASGKTVSLYLLLQSWVFKLD